MQKSKPWWTDLALTLWALIQRLTGEERQGDSEELTMSIWNRTVGSEQMPPVWGAVVGWSSCECVPGLNKHHCDWPSLGSGMNCEWVRRRAFSFSTKVAPDCTSHPSGCCCFLLGPPSPPKGASVGVALTRSSQSPVPVSNFPSNRTEEMAWLVKCLPWEQEDMSLISRTYEGEPEQPGMV
jgi:hypothetical protein